MPDMTKDEIQAAIRKHEGQSQHAFWSMRVERLDEFVTSLESLNEREEVLAACPTAPDALKALRQMQADAVTKLESLAEFAPAPKGRKKK
jgi:t-SNARE complex subunit (syntaxin)